MLVSHGILGYVILEFLYMLYNVKAYLQDPK